jgi:hypothetical protein
MNDDPFEVLLKPEGHKTPHSATVKFAELSGRYRLGVPTRPTIKYDNGHLDKYPKRDPSAADRAHLLKWIAKLEGAEALCNARTGKFIDSCEREDLSDANAAYRHFLFGNGADRTIDYERYLRGDPAAENLITNLINDFRVHAEVIGKDRVTFSVTSEPYAVGRGGFAPYPVTANWQKTLGAHFLWASASVNVSADGKSNIWYEGDLIIHIEDRYNFNPGQHDIATGIPDSENGRFEITGLGKQYMMFSTVVRHTKWKEGDRLTQTQSQRAVNTGQAPKLKHATNRH